MANSAAIIGAPTVSDVTEDTNLQVLIAAGLISISDANAGQAAFKTTVISASGNLGSLTIAANGSYSYSVADSAVQYLGAGDTKIDTFTVTSVDGTTKKVSFTIHGVNDTAVIGNATVHDVTEDATRPNLIATGSISISDVDQSQAAFKTSVISSAGTLGTLTLATNGSYSYSVADSAVQYLGAGDTKVDTFTVTALDGTTKQISFTIHGVNDAAVIGTPTVHDVTEDATQPLLTANGMISITDADQGQTAFKTSVISSAGNLGSLTIASNGSYSYSVADSAVQYLGAGDTKVDTFTVTSLDGTTKQVSFTIHGANDAAVIGTPTVHDVTEDATQPFLYAIGTISISDADQGEAAFQLGIISGAGALGTLILLPNGTYAYFVSDSAVQYLGGNDTKVDTFTVTALDGTTKQVSFTIHGTNDVAVIGTPAVHDVTEDSSATTLSAVGSISISDADQGQAVFQTTVVSAGGNLGTLTLAANGAYNYSVANSATQYLGASDTKTDTFTIASADGTTKQVTFTIHGVNDAAVIGTPTVQDVTADTSKVTLTATGSISIVDVDQGQSSFKTTVISASGNLGQLSLAANGTYTYSVAESAAAQLGNGGTKADTFTVTSLDGTTKQVTFTVHGPSGANHPAIIGDPSVHDVTEDAGVNGAGNLTAVGTISITDQDAGQATFQTTTTSAGGNLGSLALSSNGSYTYTVANSAVQYLGATDTKVDSFTIKSADGTTKVVSFTIHGTNDAAVIGDPLVHDVTEDASINGAGNLTATGTLSITDPDQNQNSFQTTVGTVASNLGTLTITSAGAYTYTVANSATQYLGGSDSKVDTFTVTALDGTPKQISFTVHGTNDAAVIGDPLVHDVTEDVSINAGNLSATGTLSIGDPDQNQNSFQTTVGTVASNLGTLTITSAGAYTYTVANSATQYLGGSDSKVDTFTVTALDGTTKQVSFTVHGNNDAAVIGTPSVADVTEDVAINGSGNLTASGSVSITDVDSAAAFQAGATGAASNLGSLQFATDGTYTYTVANSATQYLAAGDTKVDTFTVTAVDGTQKTLSFNVHGAQDAPGVSATVDANAKDDAPIALTISVQAVDTSATTIVTINGITDGYTLSKGVYFDSDGHYEIAASDLANLQIVPGDSAQPATMQLTISAASIEGGHQASTSTALTVTVGAGASDTSGTTVEGYIAGAFVFADANGNGVFDTGEASATTNADGTFTLHNAHGTLIMSGGIDVSTGLAFAGTLKAPDGATVVTPLTTLVTSVIETAAAAGTTVSASDAAAQVATAFGIDPTHIDINTFDPVPQAVAGDAAATAVLSAGVQVYSTITQMSAVGVTSTDVVSAIANAITNPDPTVVLQPGETILTSGSSVQSIAGTAGVSADAVSTVTAVVQAANATISTATDVTTIAQAGQVAQGSATASLAAITDFTDTAQTGAVTSTYVDHLADQVSAAVVPTNPPIVGTAGNDVLTGSSGIDTIDGQAGNDQISGGDGDDILIGGAGSDRIAGNAGNDHIDGGTGFDRAIYSDATGGVTINMAAGTASGAGVDSDTLTNIEGIVGSANADTYNAIGFTGNTGVPGTPVGYNEFEGGAGDDTVYGGVNAQGAYLTRVSYVSATSGVTVNLTTGVADGDASVGHDTFVGPGIQSVWGSSHDDTLIGSNNGSGTVEVFAGFAGNDTINGQGGFDRVDYNQDSTTTSGITVHLAAGTVIGDASIGTDTLISVEAVRGTNFADTYDATGFSGTSTNVGSFGTFNEFTGAGGNDTIIGNGNTRISFNNATAGVTVDLQTNGTPGVLGTTPGTGVAIGDASVGTDTFSGVNAVQGSMFNDTIYGSNNTAATETFTGNGGDDYIDGRGGFDIASYNNIYLSTGGITVNMAAGIVTGDSSIGTDTLRSIEGIQGTVNHDVYDATGYGITGSGALNVGNNGQFNQFEGLGGDDTITGNGNTRVIYANALAAVTVDLSQGIARSTAAGDAAAIGNDTITGGVNSITGSAFADTLIGDGNSNTFVGGGGNDTIEGGGNGDIAVYSGSSGQYSINNAGPTTVTDNNPTARDGIDTLTNVEVLQFTNVNLLIKSGTSGSPVDLSDTRLFFNGTANPLKTLSASSSNDFVKISQTLSGHQIDLGGGTDTVILGQSGFYNLNLANVENLVGSAGNDTANFTTNLTALNVDLGGGTGDAISLFNGANTLSATNVENINATDFSGAASNDTLTLTNNVSGVTVNLALGNNTLNLAAGANSFVNIFNVDTIHGNGSDLTVTGNGFGTPNNDLLVDLGGAGNNTLSLNTNFVSFTLLNTAHLVGSGLDDYYVLKNDVTGLSVDLGAGVNDTLNLANGPNSVSVSNVETINASDFSGAASNDTLTLLNNVSGVTVNLGQGTNALNLHDGTNSLTTYNAQTINGSATGDSLTLLNSNYGVTVDLGGGTDTLKLADGGNVVTVNNVENVIGGNSNDTITVADVTGAVTVTGGLAGDNITLGAAQANIRYTSVADSAVGSADNIANFNAANDVFTFDHVGGLVSGIHFVSSGVLDGTQSEAILTGNLLQIDVDGDGQIGAGDMQIFVNGLTGTLTDANFVTIGVDHKPTDIQLSAATVAENSNTGFVVGSLSSTDPDAGDTATYSLTDNAGGAFAISGNNLIVNGPIDYEATQSLQVTVRVTDSGGLSYDKNFVIAVTDVNEAPTVTSGATGSVAENAPTSTVVYQATAGDPDNTAPNNTISWSLTGTDANAFNIDGAGNVTLKASADFEAKSTYNINVVAIDGGALSSSKAVIVSVTDVNEAPTVTSGATGSVAENAATSTVVYQATASDPDTTAPNNTIFWSLTGTDANAFNIDGAGNLTLKASADYEAKSTYSINVVATDGGAMSATKAVTVSITDVNEAPTAVVLTNQVTSTPENGGDVKVANVAVTDDALNSNNVLSLSGTDAASFTILNGNELHFVGGANFEAKIAYDVTVNVNDTTASNHVSPDASQAFHLAITNANEAPTDISLSNNAIPQSSANNTVIGALVATDPDAGDTETFSLTSNPGGQFAISGGNLVVGGTLSAGSQQVTVRATDAGGLFVDKIFTINVSGGSTIVGDANNNSLLGTSSDDLIQGLAGNDRLQGFAGNDTLDGGVGFDRAVYADATAGLTFNLGSGTVNGAAAGVGTDTLIGIEGIVGTAFDDTYDPTGFTGDTSVPGTPTGYNEFEGGAGNDTIHGSVNAEGAYLTRVSYVSATSGVTVNLATGIADGDASVGHDTFVGPGIQSVFGSTHDDTLTGSSNGFGTVEVFVGFAGNDTVNGGGGFDRVDYNLDSTTTSGINVQLAIGKVTGDTSIGTDTLFSVEAVRGTNFADTYDATGFSGTSTNVGSNGTFNEFTGNGGNDTIIGNGNTRISFNNATAGVTVDLQTNGTPGVLGTTAGTGVAIGNSSVDTDTFSGVNAVQGSMYNDTIYGSNNAATETFTGNGGDDYIDGRGGFDIASYNNIYLSTGGIVVDMTAGTVTGDSSIGTDTLRSIEGIQGTVNHDVYDATNFGFTGFLNTSTNNVGNNGLFNQFEGLGGDDTITGNGNTRIIYANALAAVTVDLSLNTAHSTAGGDAAAIGTDTIVSGVNSITGSAFDDTLIGDGNSNTFTGGAGNDTINGNGNGDIAIYSGSSGQYTINNAGPTTVTDNNLTARDGIDTLTNVEVLQFTNVNLLLKSGTSGSPVDLSDTRLFFNGTANPLKTLSASTSNDYVKISQTLSGHQIDLGTGTDDTVILGQTGFYNLNLLNVEKLIGSGGNDTANFTTNLTGLNVDLGGGTGDTINLFNGINTLSATNVENINATDFSGTASNDTLNLSNDASGLSVNLAQGNNTLNLAAGVNSLVNVFNVQHINGSAGDDDLTISGGVSEPGNNTTIDLGTGNNSLHLGSGGTFTLLNIQHVTGDGSNTILNLNNNVTGLDVDLGGGNDNLSLANGTNSISVANVENIGGSDFSGAASNDVLTLLNDVGGGVSVNLGQGSNTLNLTAGTNTFDSLWGINIVNGTAQADTLTINGNPANTIDLGDGNDTLNLNSGANVSVANVETINASANFDNITITNAVTGSTTITAGAGADNITASAGADNFRFASVADSTINGQNDTIANFDAAHDTFTFSGITVAGINGIQFVDNGGTLLGGGQASAHFLDPGATGSGTLEIDINGDGAIDANDMVVNLNNVAGTLHSANFLLT